MKNLGETFEKCKMLLDDLMIDYQYDVTICVNNRFTRAMGRTSGKFMGCNSWGQPRYKFKIEINPAMLLDSVPQMELEDTILHELLHTVEGCQNHGPKWKSLAEKVNRAYGYHISRTGYLPEVSQRIKEKNPTRYICACKKCGQEFKFKKWCSTVANPERYSHTNCGGDLYLKWHDPKIQILHA